METLITSLRPIGNIVLICCAFFIIFGILGVQVGYHSRAHSLILDLTRKIEQFLDFFGFISHKNIPIEKRLERGGPLTKYLLSITLKAGQSDQSIFFFTSS